MHHFGHLAHGHGWAFLSVAIGVLVAIAMGFVAATLSEKDTDN